MADYEIASIPETLLMDLARKIEGKEEEKSYADKL